LYRRATLSELDAVLALMAQMQEIDPWEHPFDEVAVRCDLVELVENPSLGILQLVLDGERLVGYLAVCFDFSLEYHGKCAWIDELFVNEQYRGKGIGTRLLELAESISRDHGARTLHLEVNHGNRAIGLYHRLGFVDHHRYLMTKRL
jgi:GNAT superfamily N-acetyltransferase